MNTHFNPNSQLVTETLDVVYVDIINRKDKLK